MKGSSNKVKRIYASIGHNDYDSISLGYTIGLNDFRLKSLRINLTCSMLGSILI